MERILLFRNWFDFCAAIESLEGFCSLLRISLSKRIRPVNIRGLKSTHLTRESRENREENAHQSPPSLIILFIDSRK